MKWFNVYLRGKLIDEVSYSDASRVTADDVRRSLVNHDGYDHGIRVTQHRKKRGGRKNPLRSGRRLPKLRLVGSQYIIDIGKKDDHDPYRTARMSKKKLAAHRAKHWRFNPPTCPACGGPGSELGSLGMLKWFRCRNCGMDFNKRARARKPRTRKTRKNRYSRRRR